MVGSQFEMYALVFLGKMFQLDFSSQWLFQQVNLFYFQPFHVRTKMKDAAAGLIVDIVVTHIIGYALFATLFKIGHNT